MRPACAACFASARVPVSLRFRRAARARLYRAPASSPQGATSHCLGQNFSKMFHIEFVDGDGAC